MTFRTYAALPLLLLLFACSKPHDAALPREIDKMDAIKPALEKLTPEERELVAGYVMRKTVGAALGGVIGTKGEAGIPEGMTLGKAIEEQRKFKADREIEEAKQKALQEKLRSEREVALKKMRDAVTVTLVSKKIVPEHGHSGILLDEHLVVSFGYKNNTDKEIAGVKGRIIAKDLFGDEISAFQVSNDESIKVRSTSIWGGSRSVKFSFGSNKDRKFAELTDDKFTLIWEPQTIVFSDGTKLTAPE